MCFEFRELTPEDAAWAAPILRKSGRMGCEFSYTTAYMWSGFYDVRIAQVGDAVLFCSHFHTESPSFLVPIGVPLAEGIELLRTYTTEHALPLRLHGVDDATREQLSALYGERVRFEAHAEDYDYLYLTEALATLPGNAYHSKKNHISSFTRKHVWRYEPLTDSNVADVLAVSAAWCREKGNCADAGLVSEKCAIRRLVEHRDALSVTGGIVYVGDKAVAFTLGSSINDEVFDVHVEKALGDYAGAYAVINREFAKTLTMYRYLNRENDMGIEGLRRAKESYRPAILLKKYSCEFGL